MSDEYKELVRASRKKLSRVRFITEVEVLKAYKIATYNISKKIEDNQRRGLQTAYYENIYADLDEMAEVLENRLTKAIESGVYATVEIATGVQVMMNELFFPPEISSVANGYLRDLNYKYVKTFLAGGLYDDGKGLSDRIWEKTQKNCEDIRTLISSNIAQGANSRELARKLNNYVNPTQMTKAETIVSGMDRDIAYQAQRLARTSLTHIANETDRQNAKENVFCKGMKWNLSSSHYERQVKRWGEDICDVYANQDGYGLGKGVFPVEEYPIAHPNCLCYSTQVQPSLDDIINRVNNWVDGGEDEELEKGYQKWESGETAFQDLYSSTKQRASNKSPKDDFYTNLSKLPPEEIARVMRDKNQYERYINVLGKDNVADSLDKFMDLKYNNGNIYKDLQGLYRDVSWQKKCFENTHKTREKKIPIHNTPNSVVEKIIDNKIVTRRFFGKNGKVKLDIDFTNHGNSKEHPIAPHAHSWKPTQKNKEKYVRQRVGRELTKAEKIANKDLIKG